MLEIRPLTELNPDDFNRLVKGYTTDVKYLVGKTENEDQFTITLELVSLETPYVKRYAPLDSETFEQYRQTIRQGFSFAAYDNEECVGIALAEPHLWNKSLQIVEFHVAETHQGQGIGRRLMETVIEKALSGNLRIVVCETQNTNVPAIHFYRKMGFQIEAIDLSLYSNDDFPDGEIAVFMKKRLPANEHEYVRIKKN